MTITPRGLSRIAAALSLLLLPVLGGQAPIAFAQPPGAAASADGRYLVEFRQGGPAAVAAVRAAGGAAVHSFPELNVVAAHLPAAALQALRNNPNVVAIEEDPRRYPSAEVVPYGIPMVQADQVPWASGGSRKTCIIDSGYYSAHDDLQSSSVTATANAGSGDPFTDRCGHGTHVAGTIAALQNGTGVVGVVPNGALSLHIVKVFGDSCSWAYSSDLIAAANACGNANANIISMSLGGGVKSRFEEQKFNQLYDAGVLSIAAAGNGGNTQHHYPASYSSVVSVAAIDATKAHASFSQRTSQVELAAPGVGVLSTVPWVGAIATVTDVKYLGSGIEYAATTTAAGVAGDLQDGGKCLAGGGWSGAVVLCERGDNSFYDKVKNAQDSGARAVIIYNNASGGFAGTLGSGNTSTIPAIAISQEDGAFLRTNRVGVSSNVVNSKDAGSGYEAWDGTSMATPHVSAVAALVWSHNPGWTNANIRDALQRTAEDLGPAGRDTSFGFGLVRARAALDYLTGGTPPPPPPPPTDFTLTAIGSKVKGVQTVKLSWSGATAPSVDVYRNGAPIETVANTGSHTDSIGKGGGSYTYKVCDAGTSTCSNEAVVVF